MKTLKSVISSKKITIIKSGREGIYLEIWYNDIMGKEILSGKILVDYEKFKSFLLEVKNDM